MHMIRNILSNATYKISENNKIFEYTKLQRKELNQNVRNTCEFQ